jgi:hypothetical protein
MEQLFQQSFPKTRPAWLRGFKGVPLELDGYCEVLGIAFEHHGIQHFRAVSWTQKSTSEENSKEFAAQKQRDERKLRLCEQNGVKVLVIPEVPALLAIEDVKAKIGRELDRLKIPFPEGFSEREVDFATHIACTLEMVNITKEYDVAVIDEIQMITDKQHIRIRRLKSKPRFPISLTSYTKS